MTILWCDFESVLRFLLTSFCIKMYIKKESVSKKKALSSVGEYRMEAGEFCVFFLFDHRFLLCSCWFAVAVVMYGAVKKPYSIGQSSLVPPKVQRFVVSI